MRGSEPPLCLSHGGRARYRGPGVAERQCSARTLAGRRCERWALLEEGEEAPLCWLHADADNNGRLSHGYYRRVPYFTKSQQATIAAMARRERPLSGELLIVRLKLWGLADYLSRPELSPVERLRLTPLALNAVRAVARLLLAQRTLGRSGWKRGSAGGAGYLLAGILEEEE